MPVQLGTRGQPGFDEPIALMMDCHRRIESFLGVLERVADQFAGGPLDGEASAAVRKALRYFREAAPRHTADEEDSLFPEIRRVDSPEAAALLERAAVLEAQHRQAEALHDRVHSLLERWLDEGRLDAAAGTTLRDALSALRLIYHEHIAYEDHTLFPAAQRLLDPEAIARVGQAMAERRGLVPAP
jgi:hemerythrin-like domain-containing protein